MKHALLIYLKYGAVLILVAVVLLNIAVLVLFKVTSYLGAPTDLNKARSSGEDLLGLKDKTVLAVVAHPDDADWYAGGTLSLLAEHNEVIVVVGTSGEKGGNGDGLAEVRENEQSSAGRMLGYDEIIFLHHPDRGLAEAKTFESQLTKLFISKRPDVLFAFDTKNEAAIYHHSDHRAAGVVALEAALSFVRTTSSGETRIDAYYFHTSRPDTVAEVSEVADLKRRALSEHVSQQNSRARSIFRYLPFFPSSRMSAGSAQPYKAIQIDAGEPFRHEVIK